MCSTKKLLIVMLYADSNVELNLGKESREITNGLYASKYREEYSVSTIFSARPMDIRREILKIKPDFVHICGHSTKNEGLIIEDENNGKQILDGKILKEFFGVFSHFISCIILNSCYSSEIAEEIAEEIDVVIGMKNKIKDEDAIEFAVAFYDGVFSGESIESSFILATNSLKWNSNISFPGPIMYKKKSLSQYYYNSNFIGQNNILISPSRLPVKNEFFYGREKELRYLRDTWNNGNANIVSIEAWGGVGKTALVSKWRSEMICTSTNRAEIIFDWSFYSQGIIDNRPVNADAFFNEAFKWFGIEEIGSVKDRGEELALLVRKKKSIIILDGMEALQHTDDFIGKRGEIKDNSLKIFLSMLLDYNPGLCVITTRKQIPFLNSNFNDTCKTIKLSHFDINQSKDIIQRYKINGNDSSINAICRKYEGHALSLNLACIYIRDAFDCNADKFIAKNIDNIGCLEEEKIESIMRFYKKWFNDDIKVNILRLLSLFDRPTKQNEFNFMLTGSEILGITNGLINLTSYEISKNVRSLRRLSLLREFELENEIYLDIHPIIREYFKKELQNTYPSSFKKANNRLFEYFSICANKNTNNKEQMNLWFRAIFHGCLAERYADIFDHIYMKHIKQNEMIDDARKLGGNSTNINAISGFFSEPWTKIKGDIDDKRKSSIFAEASFALRSKGLIADAIAPLEQAYIIEKERNNYEEAAMQAGNLCELYLTIGKISEALKYANEGITIAEKSNIVWRHYWIQLAKKADILSKIGKLDFSIAYYRQAETVQKFFDKESQRLYGVLAFKKLDAYLTVLEDKILVPNRLGIKKIEEDDNNVNLRQLDNYRKQVNIALEHDLSYDRILHLALDNLIIARIEILEQIILKNQLNNKLIQSLSDAIDGLYQSGRVEYIPYGLLTCSRYWHLTKNEINMSDSISETQELIYNLQFKFFEIDLLVEKTYYNILNLDLDNAIQNLELAILKCEEIQYKRKEKEILTIKSSLREREEYARYNQTFKK
ncbi:MAG: hypothetical protein HFH73_02475 [Lachnospiraceae bacterium]|nr:hypothetical protein [Lachnospiraceae bacterium]